MKNYMRRYGTLFLLALLISLSVPQMKAVVQAQPGDRMDRPEFGQKRIERLQQAAKTLRELAVGPQPANLSEDGKQEVMNYTRWLRDASKKLDDLARRWQDDLKNKGMVKSLALSQGALEEVNTAFNARYLALRDELSQELRRFAVISHIMSSNYAIAEGSIDSLR